MNIQLTVHSLIQFGGLPKNSGRQEQTATPFRTLHWLLGPHGFGWQGSLSMTRSGGGCGIL
jgi:hypothetical protein